MGKKQKTIEHNARMERLASGETIRETVLHKDRQDLIVEKAARGKVATFAKTIPLDEELYDYWPEMEAEVDKKLAEGNGKYLIKYYAQTFTDLAEHDKNLIEDVVIQNQTQANEVHEELLAEEVAQLRADLDAALRIIKLLQ